MITDIKYIHLLKVRATKLMWANRWETHDIARVLGLSEDMVENYFLVDLSGCFKKL